MPGKQEMDKLLNNTCEENHLPDEFLNRMQKLLTENEYAAFLSSYGQKRFYSLRVNPLKTDLENALRLLGRAVSASKELPHETDSPIQGEYLKPVPWEPDGIYYPDFFRPGRLPWHEAGMYYIQEASAMAPAVLCGVQPGERVLDLCAAPGGKSTKLAVSLRGKGILVANEIHPDRAKILASNLERMGVRNALVTNETPQSLASRFPLYFDRIIVDAPCSGEGMFRKEEEALTQWSKENVRMCTQRQTEILDEAASMLRPGGRLVYSTCTFSPEENEGTIFRFLQTHPDFNIVNIHDLPGVKAKEWGFSPGRPEWIRAGRPNSDRTLRMGQNEDGSRIMEVAEKENGIPDAAQMQPIRGTVRLWPFNLAGEGHFAAVLQKQVDSGSADRSSYTAFSEDSSEEPYDQLLLLKGQTGGKSVRKKKSAIWKKRSAAKRGKTNSKKEEALGLWHAFHRESLSDSFIARTEEAYYTLFGEYLYLLPVPADNLPLAGLRILCAGLCLGNVVKGRFIPSHALGMALTKEEALRTVQLQGDDSEAFAWFRGETLSLPEDITNGWCLVCIDGCAAGWGKAAGGMIKNHYPKGLRKGNHYRPD